ncbi:MBL fold metallo-hydrolase, partial [Klebsiella oxytoca]
ITPNITSWLGVKNSLGDYIQSLYKIKKIPVQLALPAHRKNNINIYDRIEQILIHHKMRLYDTIDILSKKQPLTAY